MKSTALRLSSGLLFGACLFCLSLAVGCDGGASEFNSTFDAGSTMATDGDLALGVASATRRPHTAAREQLPPGPARPAAAEDDCFGDLNADGVVDHEDLTELIGAWGPNPNHPADFNGDGLVDQRDLVQLLHAWGECPEVYSCITDADCDDGVACTTDSCDPVAGCQNVDDCTLPETCNLSTGVCEQLPPLPIEVGDVFKYFKGMSEPSTPVSDLLWAQIGFEDSSWSEGSSGFGYDYYAETGGVNGNGDYEPFIGTELADMRHCAVADPPLCNDPGYVSVYIRRSFYVEDPATLTSLTLEWYADDGCVIYLNGTEVARSASMAGLGDPPMYDQLSGGIGGGPTPPVDVTLDLSGSIGLLQAGHNVLAAQVHNATPSSRDLLIILQLSSTDDPHCSGDGDCDDGVFCNGAETCDANGDCQPGGNPCPGQTCDEVADACVQCMVDGDCDDGDFCNGSETCAGGVCQPGTDPYLDGMDVGQVLQSDVVEASGLAASRQNPDVLWTHDDSGGGNVVFAVNTAGTLLGTYQLGSSGWLQDAEDIAIGPGPTPGVDYVYVGDIGDNYSSRSAIFVKRVPEPVVAADQAPVNVTLTGVDIITLAYPGGADAPGHKDTETLLVDTNGDLFIVTKRIYPNKVYRAAFPQSTTSTVTLQYVATLPTGTGLSWITAGDCSADGRWIILKNDQGTDYANVWYRAPGVSLWDAFAGDPCVIALQSEPQGEAITWHPDNLGFYTLSEAHHASEPIWYYERSW